ncbi:DHH family phosphoesterase [uncultured Prevotella sp.]|jgi:bifunctional oligoribonuclease and PAP phosphatase NrnA|uniref:DHH family phosphoesterase n=1 Tax=uncultured Prevotella sp. TaxID=159272 RepID=UPI0025E19FA5|nr:DHH family phosphoesterase [uncultured Prevotella sp.]
MKIELLSEAEIATLKENIDNSNRIVICCHKSPDGDALGSSLAWAEYLRTQGKEPDIIVPDAYPDFLQWLPGSERIIRYDKHAADKADEILQKADLIFCLDFNGTNRVDEMKYALEQSPAHKIMIDHHLDPSMDTVLTVSHPQMSSTSELVFRIIWQLGGFEEMSRKCAVCIYCGMMTDTGGFTYNSNQPEIFFIVSQLLTKGIDKDKIYRNVFNNFSPWAIRLRGYLMSQKLNIFNDLHAAYFTISRRDMRDFHFIKGDAEGLVNEPLKIKGMRLSISLREDDRRDNTIWVSLRSVDDFPCNLVASEFFNGGGHLNASGGRLHCTLDEAERVVRRAFAHYEDLLTK